MAEEQRQGVRPFLEVQQEVRRLFQELVHQPWGGQGQNRDARWQPCCDMVETDEAVVVAVELPGVKPEDVHWKVEGDILYITGERRVMATQQGCNYHYLEQHYGRFERQLRLPRTIDRNTIQVEFDSGILSITLPKQRDHFSVQSAVRKDAS